MELFLTKCEASFEMVENMIYVLKNGTLFDSTRQPICVIDIDIEVLRGTAT